MLIHWPEVVIFGFLLVFLAAVVSVIRRWFYSFVFWLGSRNRQSKLRSRL